MGREREDEGEGKGKKKRNGKEEEQQEKEEEEEEEQEEQEGQKEVKDRTLIVYSAFSSELTSKVLKMARVVVLTRDHTVLPATHTFIHEWNEPSCLYSPAAAHYRTHLAGIHFPSHSG